MIARTKEGRRRFEASKPGHRFQKRYPRRQESEHGWRDPRRLFYVVGVPPRLFGRVQKMDLANCG